MTIMVMGHTGYVGAHLVRWLTAQGLSVAGLSRHSNPDASTKLEREYLISDLDSASLRQYMASEVSALIVLTADTRKTAAPSDVRPLIEANASLPTEAALRAAIAGVPKVVFTSTYSISSDGAEYAPQTLYTASKKAAEDLLEYVAREFPTKVLSLRLYDIYGPQQPHNRLIPYLMERIARSEPISMTSGEQEICPIYIDDVCGALRACISADPPEARLHIRSAYGSDVVQVRHLPRRIADAIGKDLPPVHFDRPPRPREIQHFDPNHALPEDWEPLMSLDGGLRETWDAGQVAS